MYKQMHSKNATENENYISEINRKQFYWVNNKALLF
jgi:hypothetical protein